MDGGGVRVGREKGGWDFWKGGVEKSVELRVSS